MNRRDVLRYIALTCAFLTLAGLGWYTIFVPHTLRMGFVRAGGEPAQFFTAFAHQLEAGRAPVRLTVTGFLGTRPVVEAFESGRIDLAIMRADLPIPAVALGVAVAHQFVVVLAVRPGAGIARIGDLDGRTVGVLGRGTANTNLLERIVELHGLSVSRLHVVPLEEPDDIGKLAEQNLDAVFMALPRGSRLIGQTIVAFQDAVNGTPVILPFTEAAVLSKRNPMFKPTELAAGEIMGAPRLPLATTASVTFPALVLAHRGVEPAPIYEFTKQLFMLRQSLVGQHQAAARIEALSTDRGSPIAVHPGAATYYDASEVTFTQRYSDVMWLLLFGFSSVLSLLAWTFSLAFPKRREVVKREHAELIELIDAVRKAPTLAAIEAIDRRVDQIVADMSELVFKGRINGDQKPAFDLLLDRLDTVLQNRRQEIRRS